MLDYIRESPEKESEIIRNSKEYTEKLVEFYLDGDYKGICFIASGSSYNACLCARYFIEHILDIEVKVISPFTFLHHDIDHIGDLMFVGVSQSGCSTNTIEALEELRNRKIKTACLTGNDDCDVKDKTDLLVNWGVGEEKIGFVTKGVNTLVCFLMSFAVELAERMQIINGQKYQHIREKLQEAVDLQKEMMDSTVRMFEEHRQDFINPRRAILLSSGPNYGTVCEGALKIAETSCITAIAYEAEEFLHGPLYPSQPDDLIILVDNNDDESSSRINDIALALKDITEKVYVIGNSDQIDKDHRFSTSSQTCPYRSPLYKLTCLQTLAYLMTQATNNYEPHDVVKSFKKANKVVNKSRKDLYLDLQKIY